jgi:hypothetical protein
MRARVLAACCVVASFVGPSSGVPDKSACGEETVGAWEYVPPSDPGRVSISRLPNGHLLIVWIVTPRDGAATNAGAWEGTGEGSRRHWRILFATDPATVGAEVTEEFEAGSDTVRFWLLGADGKRGPEGAARRIK